jgi:hypothetical protein
MKVFNADKPITGSPKSPDLLNREEYSLRIAKGILLDQDSDSLVLSVEGKWGTGKTSVLNLIKKHVKKITNNNAIVVNFNPWLLDDKEKLLNKFLVQVATIIGSKSKKEVFKRTAKQILKYSNLFADLFQKVPVLAPDSHAVAKIVSYISDKSLIYLNKLDDYNIDKQRLKVEVSLKKIENNIIVFIDDIDRLSPDEIYMMIKTLKVISEFPRFAIVTAFESSYVVESLKKFGVNEPELYLDKLIQVRINLPVFDKNDLSILFDRELNKLPALEKITSLYPSDKDRFSELYHFAYKFLVETPRDIKRIFNRVQLSQKSILEDVSFVDMLSLDILAIKAPKIFEDIKDNPHTYIGEGYWENDIGIDEPIGVVKNRKEDLENILNEYPDKRKYIEFVLKKLFPYIDGVKFNRTTYRNNGRVAIPDRLAIALSFSMPKKEVSISIIKKYFFEKNGRTKINKSIVDLNKVYRFLFLMNGNIQQYEIDAIDDLKNLIYSISLLADTKESEESIFEGDIFKADCIKLIYWTVLYIIEKTKEEKRVEILKVLFGNGEYLTISTELLRHLLDQYDYFNTNKDQSTKEKLIGLEKYKEFLEIWKDIVKTSIGDKTFFNLTGRHRILGLLSNLDKDLFVEIVKELIKCSDGLDTVAIALSSRGNDSIKGYYMQYKENSDLNGLNQKIIKLAEERLIENGSECNRIKAALKSIVTRKGIYTSDCTETSNI